MVSVPWVSGEGSFLSSEMLEGQVVGRGRGYRDIRLVPQPACILPLSSRGSCQSQEGCYCLEPAGKKGDCTRSVHGA